LAVLAVCAVLAATTDQLRARQATAPYLNPDLPADKRAADLVSRMSLDEKVSQLVNDAPAIPRLNVPAYEWWNECLHGVARSGAATVFPQAIGMAASFDAPLLHEVATVISDEARAKHHEYERRGLHALNERHAQLPGQKRIFAIRLLPASPARVTEDIYVR